MIPKTSQFFLLNDIVEKIIENFRNWQLAQQRGQSLCNSIESVKTKCLENITSGETRYPETLKPYCDKLAIILTIFEDIVENTRGFVRQLKSLATNSEEVFFRTWAVQEFVGFASTILESYQKEFVVKKFVTEEIAHCEERCELIRLASLWEYPAHVDDGVKFMFILLAEEIREK